MFFSLFGNNENHRDMTMNIQQGEYYKKVNRCFTDSGRIHMAPLQLTSAPYLSSISEAMQGNDSTVSSNSNTTIPISVNEDEFNKTLVEYTTLYNTFSEESLKKNSESGASANAPIAIDPGILQRLIALNNKLVDLADKINKEISDLKVTDANLKSQISDHQSSLANYITQLKDQQIKINSMEDVDGFKQNTELVLISNKYHYLVWFILVLTIIAIILYTISNDNVPNSIVLIVSLLTIYFVSVWINNEFIRYQ